MVAGHRGEEEEGHRLHRMADHLGQHQPHELPHRRRGFQAKGGPKPGAAQANQPNGEVQQRPEHRPNGRAIDPHRIAEGDGADDDAGVVEQRRQAVSDESSLGQQHVADAQRGGEDDRRDQHHPEQGGVELLLLRGVGEAEGDEWPSSAARTRRAPPRQPSSPARRRSGSSDRTGWPGPAPRARSCRKIGMKGAASPLATSTSSRSSGSTKAAL